MKAKLIIWACFISGVSSAQSPQAEKSIREGNEFYKQQQFDKAAAAYDKAMEVDPNNGPARFNLGNTLYKQNKPDEAVKVFDEVTGSAGKNDLKPKAYYNKGAVLSRQKKLEESIEAYKSALRLDPEDKEARENLQKALLELKKKQPPKKEEQDKKKKQQEQQKKQPQSKMSPKEAQQRLKLLAQKEKEVQQRIQKEKSKSGGNQVKDW